MMFNGLVSIVIPAYNRENTIDRAIRSVLAQTYQNIEVIVVDDCSTDNTNKVVNEILDLRLCCYKLTHNSGACAARNYGVAHANGEIVAFQDSDDYWYEDKLSKQLIYLKDNHFEFLSCGFTRIQGDKREQLGFADCPTEKSDLWCKLLNHNWVSTQTIICYKYCFEKIRFDPLIKRYQDWDVALQAACYFRIGSMNESLVDAYLQENSITNLVNNDTAKIAVIRKHHSDINPCNRSMKSQYYKSLADAERSNMSYQASKHYWKSFMTNPRMKTLLCWGMCTTGLIRFYENRK